MSEGMYVPVYNTVREHEKTYKLADCLGVSRAQAVGHLVLLWQWAMLHRPDGVLGEELRPSQLAGACMWDGDQQRLADALEASGYVYVGVTGDVTVDGQWCLSGWGEGPGKMRRARAANAARQKRWRAGAKPASPTTVRVASTVTPTLPSPGNVSVTPEIEKEKEKEKKKERGTSGPTTEFLQSWDLWREAGGRLQTSKAKTWEKWQRAAKELALTGPEIASRLRSFLEASPDPNFLPDLARVLYGAQSGCRLTDDNLASMAVRAKGRRPDGRSWSPDTLFGNPATPVDELRRANVENDDGSSWGELLGGDA